MIRKLAMGVAVAALLLLLFEGALRLAGRPHGTYSGTYGVSVDLWPPNYSKEMRWGPIPYRVESNSQGFRGPELRSVDDPAEVRIVAIGDSMTDGFFVDNDDTYPSQLARILRERGVDAEVINAARGGGSIHLFNERLRRIVLGLAPQVVIVSFVTNDLTGIAVGPTAGRIDWLEALGGAFVTRTGIGEVLMEAQLRLLGDDPVGTEELLRGLELAGDARYRIPGGKRYAENSRRFLRRYRKSDGPVLVSQLSSDVLTLLEDYLEELERFRSRCAENGITPLYVYFPAYPQIYLSGAPTTIQDLLAERAAEIDLPFLDLTAALRREGAHAPLHLAPLDFHLNPRGNEVVAEAIAAALIDWGLLESAAVLRSQP